MPKPRIHLRAARLCVLAWVAGGIVGWSRPAQAASGDESQAPPAASSAKATPTDSKVATANDAPDLSWVPPPDDFDWIQLKSGEWLKGRIKAMQDDHLEFDSEKLDELTFEWDDIRQLRSARRLDLLVQQSGAEEQDEDARSKPERGLFGARLSEQAEELSGLVTVTPDEVRVVNGVVHTVMPRSRLQSLTPGGSRERDHWTGKASIGLTLRSGNLEQIDYDAMFMLQRRTPNTRLSLDYIGNVSSVAEVESANNHRVNGEFDFWLSGNLYLIIPALEYFTDRYQNIDSRVTAGAGLGYALFDSGDFRWTISAGPAYQWLRYASVQPGEPTESESAALVLSSSMDWEISKSLDLKVNYSGQVTSKEVGETNHHFTTTFSVDLTKSIDFDISFVWDRISQPTAGQDGVVPEKDDYRLIFGLGMDF